MQHQQPPVRARPQAEVCARRQFTGLQRKHSFTAEVQKLVIREKQPLPAQNSGDASGRQVERRQAARPLQRQGPRSWRHRFSPGALWCTVTSASLSELRSSTSSAAMRQGWPNGPLQRFLVAANVNDTPVAVKGRGRAAAGKPCSQTRWRRGRRSRRCFVELWIGDRMFRPSPCRRGCICCRRPGDVALDACSKPRSVADMASCSPDSDTCIVQGLSNGLPGKLDAAQEATCGGLQPPRRWASSPPCTIPMRQ